MNRRDLFRLGGAAAAAALLPKTASAAYVTAVFDIETFAWPPGTGKTIAMCLVDQDGECVYEGYFDDRDHPVDRYNTNITWTHGLAVQDAPFMRKVQRRMLVHDRLLDSVKGLSA